MEVVDSSSLPPSVSWIVEVWIVVHGIIHTFLSYID